MLPPSNTGAIKRPNITKEVRRPYNEMESKIQKQREEYRNEDKKKEKEI